MSEKSVLHLVNQSAQAAPIGQGAFAQVFAISDPRFADYLLKVYRAKMFSNDISDVLRELRKYTALTPVEWPYLGKNFGQALLSTIDYPNCRYKRSGLMVPRYDIEFIAKQRGASLKDQFAAMHSNTQSYYQSALQYLNAVNAISNEGWQVLFDEIRTLGMNGIGVDFTGSSNNLFYAPDRLHIIDIPTSATEGVHHPHYSGHVSAVFSAITAAYREYGDDDNDNKDIALTKLIRSSDPIKERLVDVARAMDFPLDREKALRFFSNVPIFSMAIIAKRCSVGSIIRLSDSPDKLLEALNAVKSATITQR